MLDSSTLSWLLSVVLNGSQIVVTTSNKEGLQGLSSAHLHIPKSVLKTLMLLWCVAHSDFESAVKLLSKHIRSVQMHTYGAARGQLAHQGQRGRRLWSGADAEDWGAS